MVDGWKVGRLEGWGVGRLRVGRPIELAKLQCSSSVPPV